MYPNEALQEPPQYEEAIARSTSNLVQQTYYQNLSNLSPPTAVPTKAKMSSTTKGVKKAFSIILASVNLIPYLLIVASLVYGLIKWDVSCVLYY